MLAYYTQSKMLSACPRVEVNMTCSCYTITTFTAFFLAAISTNDPSTQLPCLPCFAHCMHLKSVIDRGLKSRALFTKCTTTVVGIQATPTCAFSVTKMCSGLSALKITSQTFHFRAGHSTPWPSPSILVRSPHPISAGNLTTLSLSTTSI